jgi:hypothetical protein
MDEEYIEAESAKDAAEILEQLDGWPVVLGDKWAQEETFSWYKMAQRINDIGLHMDIILTVGREQGLTTLIYNHPHC